MKSWFTDTLAGRLFTLIWVTLVASHLAAFAAVRLATINPRGNETFLQALPTLPSLPPTPGLPDTGPPLAPPATGVPDMRRPAMPLRSLLLDYGVRLAVICAAAWFGSRWLARPLAKFADASHALGTSVAAGQELARMDENAGTREVRAATKVFNRMAGQLRQQFKSRGLMVASMSHDLRTPLTRVRIRLESMSADPVLQAKSVADVREMNELIDNVMEVFRPGGKGAAEARQPTDVAALVQSIVDDLIEQGQPVAYSGPASAVALVGPAALRRVVGNVVANALRYGLRAQVRVERQRDDVTVTIDDEGPGIPAAELESVFEPFYRVEGSRNRDTGGNGLGLYIARELLDQMNGEIRLLNRAGHGLRAQITLRGRADGRR